MEAENIDKEMLLTEFKKADKDQDGRINKSEAHQLLSKLGFNVYQGTVTLMMKRMNFSEQSEEWTFPQFLEYYLSERDPGKRVLFEEKYKILQQIHELRKDSETKIDAAPGAAPSKKNQSPEIASRGDISLLVGPEALKYESFIEIMLEKFEKQESKPYVKIVFLQDSDEQAQKLESLIKQFHKGIIHFISNSGPEFTSIAESFNVITNVSGSKVTLFITTTNEMVEEIAKLKAEYFDTLLSDSGSGYNLYYRSDFSISIPEYLDQSNPYALSELFAKDTRMKMKWEGCNFRQKLKKFYKSELTETFKLHKKDVISLFLLIMLHSELCQVDLVFGNAEQAGNQIEIKKHILHQITDIVSTLTALEDDEGLNSLELLTFIKYNIQSELSVGNWKVKLNFNIKDFNLIFKFNEQVEIDSD